MKPKFEYGFWWWFDAKRVDWFIGCSPSFGAPSWAQAKEKKE